MLSARAGFTRLSASAGSAAVGEPEICPAAHENLAFRPA
jgi:hypothetical protein